MLTLVTVQSFKDDEVLLRVIRFPDGGRTVLSTFTAIARHLAVPLGATGCKSKKMRFAILHR